MRSRLPSAQARRPDTARKASGAPAAPGALDNPAVVITLPGRVARLGAEGQLAAAAALPPPAAAAAHHPVAAPVELPCCAPCLQAACRLQPCAAVLADAHTTCIRPLVLAASSPSTQLTAVIDRCFTALRAWRRGAATRRGCASSWCAKGGACGLDAWQAVVLDALAQLAHNVGAPLTAFLLWSSSRRAAGQGAEVGRRHGGGCGGGGGRRRQPGGGGCTA